jgi:hypothetical protein
MNKTSAITAILLVLGLTICVAGVGYQLKNKADECRGLQMKLALNRETIKTLTYQRDLALEFDLSLAIVMAVDAKSRTLVDPGKEEWKYIPNHQFCTYLMLSLIHVESGGQMVVGDGGRAIGISQIWLTTAKLYNPKLTKEELMRPEVNVDYMFRHFVSRLKARRGNFAEVLFDWNRGPAKVDKLVKMGKPIENGYSEKVYRAKK